MKKRDQSVGKKRSKNDNYFHSETVFGLMAATLLGSGLGYGGSRLISNGGKIPSIVGGIVGGVIAVTYCFYKTSGHPKSKPTELR